MTVITGLCVLMTLVCSVEPLVINDVTATITTQENDNTAYENYIFQVIVNLKLDYMSNDQSVIIELWLPQSNPETTTTCEELITDVGEEQNCRTTTTTVVYATVDPTAFSATVGSNLAASVNPPGVTVESDGSVPQALCRVNFGSVHSIVNHATDSNDVISVTIDVKIKPGFSILTHAFSAVAIIDNGMEENETSVNVQMRGPFLTVAINLEQEPYSDIEAGQRLYYSVRIDHLPGSTESAVNCVLTVQFESTDQAPLVTDESAFYYSSSNPSTEASFNGDIFFSTGLNLNTPLGVSEYVEVHFRRNVTAALELDKDLKITASVDYTNPAGTSYSRTVDHSVATKPINYTSVSTDVIMTSDFPVGKTIIMRKTFMMPKGTLKNFDIFAQFQSNELATIPLLFESGYSSISIPNHIQVADGKTAFLGRDFTISTSWQYRRRRSAEDDRQKRATQSVTSVTVPFGDITNPVVDGISGTVITALLRFPVDTNTTGGAMTAESGLRYNGLKKYMFSGAANIQRPDIVVEKTVEMVDNVTIPNIVRFNVTVTHTPVSNGPAYNIKVNDGSKQFSVYWGIESVGLTIGDPNLQIVDDKIMTLTQTRLDKTQEMFFSYKATPAKGVELPAGNSYYNASVFYTSSSKPNIGQEFGPNVGSCCISRVDYVVDNVFTNKGYAILMFVCGVIIGVIIVVLVLFMLYQCCRYKMAWVGSTSDEVDGRGKMQVYGQGLILDHQRAAKKGRVQTIKDLSDMSTTESIVVILASKNKVQTFRELDNLDILDTVSIDEDIEKERNTAMIDSTDALIHSLKLNGDINKNTEDKCTTNFRRKARDQEKELDSQFQQDMETLFKSLSAKNKEKLADVLDKHEEEDEALKEKTANLPPKEQKEMTEMLTKQHEMERSDLTHRLKLEQDEEVEKLRKEYAIRKRIGIKGLQQDVLDNVRTAGKLNPEQYDWLMKEHFKNQATVEKLFDDEISRQRMMLQEKLARRRLLAETNDMEEESHNTLLDTMANQTLQVIQKGKKAKCLSGAESKLLIDRMTEQMVETKEKFDADRRMQEMSLQARLSERKKKKLADLSKKHQQEVKELGKKQHSQQTQAFDPISQLEEKQQLISHQRAEHAEIENEIDTENAEELKELRGEIMVKTKEELVQEKQSIVEQLKQNGMSEEQLEKILSKHDSNLKTLTRQQEEDKQRQQENFKKKLEVSRREWLQQREEEKEEQVALREHEENIVRSLLGNQVAMSEEERDRVLQEHEKQMVKLENSLTLNKLQQKRMLEERMSRKRAQKLEALEKKQLQDRKKKKRTANDEDEDSDEDEKELRMLQKHSEQRLAILQEDDSMPEDEVEEIRAEMMKERANSLKEQEVQLGAMLAELQIEKAKEMAKIEEQQKAIHNLKSNLMDDLNDKGILSDPQCQKVIEVHQKEQEKLNKKLDSQRSKQEKALKKRLQERLRQKEETLAKLHEQQLNDELSSCASSTAAKLRRIAIKHKHMVEMEQFRNRIDLEINQTLEEMKRQNEVRRLQERQEQEMQFINGLVRLGKFHRSELDNVIEMLFPNKSEEEHKALMEKLCEGYKSPPPTPEGSIHDDKLVDAFNGRRDSSLVVRVKSAMYRRGDNTQPEQHQDSGKRKKKSSLQRRKLPKAPPGVGATMQDDFHPYGPMQPRPDPVGRSYSPDIYREEGTNYGRMPPSRLAPLKKSTKKKSLRRSSVMFEDDDF